MRVRNTVNHEFESQLERVEYVWLQTNCGGNAPVWGGNALMCGGNAPMCGGNVPMCGGSSKTTYLKMAAIVKRWIACTAAR